MGLLGAHVSMAGGLYKAIERGDALRCESIQLFVQSSRTWKIPSLEKEDVELFRLALANAKSVKRVIAHNSYLLNLTTASAILRKKSIRYFIETLERCELLGIESLITHPGSHLGAGLKAAIRYTAKSLDEVLKACSGFRTKLLLENTAGQGDCIGHQFSELRQIAESCREGSRILFCFDTQHAFAAGHDLRSAKDYASTFSDWDREIGLDRIAAFHVNDATKDLGSRVDRHENIGKGFLGRDPFRRLVNDPRFSDVPMCIETDPGDKDRKHKADLKLLFSFLD